MRLAVGAPPWHDLLQGDYQGLRLSDSALGQTRLGRRDSTTTKTLKVSKCQQFCRLPSPTWRFFLANGWNPQYQNAKISWDTTDHTSLTACFANGRFAITPSGHLTLGVRESEDKIDRSAPSHMPISMPARQLHGASRRWTMRRLGRVA